jgi:hypothetical protein
LFVRKNAHSNVELFKRAKDALNILKSSGGIFFTKNYKKNFNVFRVDFENLKISLRDAIKFL